MKRIKNPFSFINTPHEVPKIRALFDLEDSELCACDMEGKPQAFFVLPIVTKVEIVPTLPTNPLVLGSQRGEEFLIEYKPTLMLEHKLI